MNVRIQVMNYCRVLNLVVVATVASHEQLVKLAADDMEMGFEERMAAVAVLLWREATTVGSQNGCVLVMFAVAG